MVKYEDMHTGNMIQSDQIVFMYLKYKYITAKNEKKCEKDQNEQ